MLQCCLRCGFFFQAEDGIRDLVRSRGLGDVYKRQGQELARIGRAGGAERSALRTVVAQVVVEERLHVAVSYTHLTLPTSDLV